MEIWDWQVTILHICKSPDEANRIEIEEIRNFNSVIPNGYNLTHGGGGGDFWSGQERPEISKMNRERNPMKDPKIARKQGEAQRGIQIGKKNGRYTNGYYTKVNVQKRKINSLRRRLKKSEKSI